MTNSTSAAASKYEYANPIEAANDWWEDALVFEADADEAEALAAFQHEADADEAEATPPELAKLAPWVGVLEHACVTGASAEPTLAVLFRIMGEAPLPAYVPNGAPLPAYVPKVPLAVALSATWKTDAHFTAYETHAPVRVNKEALGSLPVRMVLFVVDVDGKDHKADEAWREAERAKIKRAVAGGAFAYETRGGYRLVWMLSELFTLERAADAARWKASYVRNLERLKEEYGIAGDEKCSDFGRLFRLPRVLREGTPLDLPTYGDVWSIGTRDFAIVDVAPSTPRAPSVRGVATAIPDPRTLAKDGIDRFVEIVAPIWPPDGARNEARMALSGGLALHLSDDDAVRVLHALYRQIGEEKERLDLRDHVERSRQTRANGGEVTGWPKLGELLGNPARVNEARDVLFERVVLFPPAPANDAMTEGGNDRPVILVEADMHTTVDTACAALSRHPDVFQRGGRLVQKLSPTSRDGGASVPTLREIPPSVLASELSRVAAWQKYDGRAKKPLPCEPPERIVSAVAQAGQWPGVRCLVGITETPTLRANGSILQTPGYDSSTALLYEPGVVAFPPVGEAPTLEDARAALAALQDVFREFPFEREADKLVPVAIVLTSLAMPALEAANVPAFVFDANVQGTGKTLCGDACAWILTGREMPKQTFPTDDKNELEKILGGAARAATPMLMLDNVNGTFGGDALESRMTCRGKSNFRILGRSENADLPWRTIIIASGNNIRSTVDMRRRIIRCRLVATQENPEERPIERTDLRGYIVGQRPRLIAAGLTILRAYFHAGRPQQGVGHMGNFEEWCALVAGALKWTSGVDVTDARMPSAATSDPTTEAYAAFLEEFGSADARWKLGVPYCSRDLATMTCWDELIPPEERSRAARVGLLLGKMNERPIGKRQVVKVAKDSHAKTARFKVVGI